MTEQRLQRAQRLEEIGRAFLPRPLRRDELEEFFVPTAEARDPDLIPREQLRKHLENNAAGECKVLLVGHPSTGKSTELVQLAIELGEPFFIVDVNVERECNLAHVTLQDVLVVLVDAVLAAGASASPGLRGGLEASPALQAIHDWFQRDVEDEGALADEARVEGGDSLLARTLGLTAGAKLFIRRQDRRAHRRPQEEARRLASLLARCNALLGELKLGLFGLKRHLVIIIEGLDKVNLTDARAIFLEQTAVLGELRTHLVMTIPISLLHSPSRDLLDRYFECFVLPMPKVQEMNGKPCAEGVAVFQAIVERRLLPDLIEPGALQLAIDKTGGVLGDLFAVLLVAGDVAESRHRRQLQDARIVRANVERGLTQRRRDYMRKISPLNLPAEWQDVDAQALWDRLRQLRTPRRMLQIDRVAMALLQAKALLEYNGEGWFAVHPLVLELLDGAR